MRTRVSVVKCESYSESVIVRSLTKSLELIGGLRKFVRPGNKVVLKPNLVAARKPDHAVTTHPSIVACLARMIKEIGADVLIVDSPGYDVDYSTSSLRHLYQETGMIEAAEDAGAKLNYDTSYRTVSFPPGRTIDRFAILSPILDADVVINLPKLKTHELTYLTGAVKNLLGVIPGKIKAGYHVRLENAVDFSGMLLDLLSLINPRLTIVDAIVSLEGHGPINGRPKELGLLFASENSLALDSILAETIGVRPETIPFIKAATGQRRFSRALEDVEIVGDGIESIQKSKFLMPRIVRSNSLLQQLIVKICREKFFTTPNIIQEKCAGCSICKDNCSENAVQISHGKTSIDSKKCVRCYYCYEACPEKAVGFRKLPFMNTESLLYFITRPVQ